MRSHLLSAVSVTWRCILTDPVTRGLGQNAGGWRLTEFCTCIHLLAIFEAVFWDKLRLAEIHKADIVSEGERFLSLFTGELRLLATTVVRLLHRCLSCSTATSALLAPVADSRWGLLTFTPGVDGLISQLR